MNKIGIILIAGLTLATCGKRNNLKNITCKNEAVIRIGTLKSMATNERTFEHYDIENATELKDKLQPNAKYKIKFKFVKCARKTKSKGFCGNGIAPGGCIYEPEQCIRICEIKLIEKEI